MFQWHLVTIILGVQILGLLILTAPVPMRLKTIIVRGYSRLWHGRWTVLGLLVLCTFLGGMLLQSWVAMNRLADTQFVYNAKERTTLGKVSLGEKHQNRMKLYREQRNVYMSAISSLYLLVFWGMGRLICQLQRIRDDQGIFVTRTLHEEHLNKQRAEPYHAREDAAKAEEKMAEAVQEAEKAVQEAEKTFERKAVEETRTL